MTPNTHQGLFLICHLSVLTSITSKTTCCTWPSCIWKTAVRSETFFLWFRVAWEIQHGQLHTQTCSAVVLIYNILCVLQAHTYIIILCTTMHHNKVTWLMTVLYTPNNGFNSYDVLFYKNKVLRHALTAAAVHSIYLNIASDFPI